MCVRMLSHSNNQAISLYYNTVVLNVSTSQQTVGFKYLNLKSFSLVLTDLLKHNNKVSVMFNYVLVSFITGNVV